ncbi:MAG TPA: hypothetical protein VHB46_00495 [Burkholderiales bacterium]|nr:hypothetical protein [Burkholderiales bacterium]
MFPRLNFLLGLGLLILIGFYLAAVYLVVGPLSRFAPDWANVAAGAAILLAVGLTVQFLATAMSSLSGVARYGPATPAGPASFVSQVALAMGHVGMLFIFLGLVADDRPASLGRLLAIAALYLAGVVVAVREWKRRKALAGAAK